MNRSDTVAIIDGPILHLTFRRFGAAKNPHLLGNSTTAAVKTTQFYRQNVSYMLRGFAFPVLASLASKAGVD
jgi:hypothetical protein